MDSLKDLTIKQKSWNENDMDYRIELDFLKGLC